MSKAGPSDEAVKAAAAIIEQHKYEQWTVDKAEEIARAILSSHQEEIEGLRKALGEIEGLDSAIDATLRSDGKDRRITAGPFAQIARRALEGSKR